eukprot:873013-Prymnesium_polylepis.1
MRGSIAMTERGRFADMEGQRGASALGTTLLTPNGEDDAYFIPRDTATKCIVSVTIHWHAALNMVRTRRATLSRHAPSARMWRHL